MTGRLDHVSFSDEIHPNSSLQKLLVSFVQVLRFLSLQSLHSTQYNKGEWGCVCSVQNMKCYVEKASLIPCRPCSC